MNKKSEGTVIDWWSVSRRVIMIKLHGNPLTVNVIQEYSPATESSEDYLQQLYEEMDDASKSCKLHDQ
ncbi:hypothetical protein E2C01_044815 [Portunus trituberculatus]|uniref:Uncharacterized protein n=1 Tax=Portunus trituberculatus TaxID=210409 RepID=A0A5B7FT38_PORTR|nr:hypothetical protein [Portunus trituberculatus]